MPRLQAAQRDNLPSGPPVVLSISAAPRLSPAFLSVPPLSCPSAVWGKGLLPLHESARNVFTSSRSLWDPGEWCQAPGREDRPWGDSAMFRIALHTELKG